MVYLVRTSCDCYYNEPMPGLVFWWTGESGSTVTCQWLSWRGQLGEDTWVQTRHDPSRRTRTLVLCIRGEMVHGLSRKDMRRMTCYSNQPIDKESPRDIHLRQRHSPFSRFPAFVQCKNKHRLQCLAPIARNKLISASATRAT